MVNKLLNALILSIFVVLAVCIYLLYMKLEEHDQKISQIQDTLSWTVNTTFIPE